MVSSDAVVLAASAAAAYALRTGPMRTWFRETIQPPAFFVIPGAVVVVLCLVSIGISRLYEDRRYLSRLEQYAALVKAVTYAILVALAFAFALREKELSRSILGMFWVLACALLVLERSAWHQLVKSVRRRGGDSARVAALVPPGGLPRLRRLLGGYPELGYRIAGVLVAGGNLRRNLAKLESWVQAGRIDALLVGVPSHAYHRVVPYLAWCEERYLPHHRLSSAFDAYHGAAESPGSLPPVDPKPVYTAAKRMLDELGALALLALTSPVWIAVAIAIRFDSPGPVLFVQDRVGRHGRLFRCLKFRTMYVHAPRYALTARSAKDPRVTPVGRFLRRTSLDELPQLVNVLKGEMSLVGPRPEMPFMVDRNTPLYRRRLMVLPGLTGLWQAVARHEPLEESLRYDLYYIQHRSLVFDFVIMARTAFSVLRGRGAY